MGIGGPRMYIPLLGLDGVLQRALDYSLSFKNYASKTDSDRCCMADVMEHFLVAKVQCALG